MNFSEKLTALRRKQGWSQEQLADALGVTRQSVSKWEGGAAMPELPKLIALSELFHVTVDYLVKDGPQEPELPGPGRDVPASARLEEQVEELSSYFRCWAWDSAAHIGRLPLVSVRLRLFGRTMRSKDVARGVIAIGNVAVGVVALGMLSVGAVSLGILSAGLLALGVLAFGPVALGVVAIGWVAFGVAALGQLCAGGVTALSSGTAVGVAAVGDTAVGCDAAGNHVLLWGGGLTQGEVREFLLRYQPRLWGPLADVLGALGSHLK